MTLTRIEAQLLLSATERAATTPDAQIGALWTEFHRALIAVSGPDRAKAVVAELAIMATEDGAHEEIVRRIAGK
jgi:hypothetical protein